MKVQQGLVMQQCSNKAADEMGYNVFIDLLCVFMWSISTVAVQLVSWKRRTNSAASWEDSYEKIS